MLSGIPIAFRRARLLPPCIRHRLRPFTAGDWHSLPERVRAKQRGACASRAGWMALIGIFRIFLPPGMMMELIGNNRLPAFVDMHVAHRLLARLVQLGQRLQCRPALGLSLQGDARIGFRRT